ncbi:MAG: hypothetical protein IH840_11770 [Candidatus Heimdallarchaeota archaeon]|nr:hypothetical protein [Candidatus Heimdallarchaeota archaeon]
MRKGITLIFLLVLTSSSIAESEVPYTLINLNSLDPSATKLYTKFDQNGLLHFLYLTGDQMDFVTQEPTPASTSELSSNYTLVYGYLGGGRVIFSENVSQNVGAYHYNLQFDSKNNAHTTFISTNYTLIYATRNDQSTQWTFTTLTTASDWFSFAPSIEIGTNDEPRIVYAAQYNEDGAGYWGYNGELISSQAIHYTLLTDNDWLFFDITNNNNPLLASHRSQARLIVTNPNLVIKDQQAYVTFSKKNQLAAESSIQIVQFSELPSTSEGDSETGYFSDATSKLVASSTITTVYTRSDIEFLSNLEQGRTGLVVVFGSWNYGGANLAYYESDTKTSQNIQMVNLEIDLSLRAAPVLSMDIEYNLEADKFLAVWSVYDLFSQGDNGFTFDIRIGEIASEAFADFDLSIDRSTETEFDTGRVTDTINKFHIYPNLEQNSDGEWLITFLSNDDEYTLSDGTFTERSSVAESSTSAILLPPANSETSSISNDARQISTVSVDFPLRVWFIFSGLVILALTKQTRKLHSRVC